MIWRNRKKGVRLEHISKIYTDPKTGKEFYAVQDTTLDIEPGSFVTLLGAFRVRQDHSAALSCAKDLRGGTHLSASLMSAAN